MRSPYTLYKREGIWYGSITVTMPDGQKNRKRFSTSCSTKAEAVAFCLDLLRKGKIKQMKAETFGNLAAGWWNPATCPYIKESRRNGKELSRSYIDSSRAALVNYLLPVFKDVALDEISTQMIEEWKYSLVEQHRLSNKSTNNYLSILHVMLDYWWRHGVIQSDPSVKVKPMSKRGGKTRGILTVEETHRLFTSEVWDNHIGYLANLLAAVTGMRMGEIMALRVGDVRNDDSIVVAHSYDEYVGLKSTKTGAVRVVPVPHRLALALMSLRTKTGEYLFSLKDPTKPVYRSCVIHSLRRALVNIGVSLEEQKRRNITFHSWRHFLNTRLRASGLPDSVTRQVTGHADAEMTELYSHFSASDLQGILVATNGILPISLTIR
jgi:integrase